MMSIVPNGNKVFLEVTMHDDKKVKKGPLDLGAAFKELTKLINSRLDGPAVKEQLIYDATSGNVYIHIKDNMPQWQSHERPIDVEARNNRR